MMEEMVATKNLVSSDLFANTSLSTAPVDNALTKRSASHDLGAPLRVEMRIKNNRLMNARFEAGCKTVTEAAGYIGVNLGVLSAYETLREQPYNAKTGDWKGTAQRIAEFYGYSCEELWPEAVAGIKERALAIELASSAADTLLDEHIERTRLLPERIGQVLDTLPDRVRRVVIQRFGIGNDIDHTFLEVGKADGGTSKERIRQIEAQALRSIRDRSVSRLLEGFVKEPTGDPEPKVLCLKSAVERERLKIAAEEASRKSAAVEHESFCLEQEQATGFKRGQVVWWEAWWCTGAKAKLIDFCKWRNKRHELVHTAKIQLAEIPKGDGKSYCYKDTGIRTVSCRKLHKTRPR